LLVVNKTQFYTSTLIGDSLILTVAESVYNSNTKLMVDVKNLNFLIYDHNTNDICAESLIEKCYVSELYKEGDCKYNFAIMELNKKIGQVNGYCSYSIVPFNYYQQIILTKFYSPIKNPSSKENEEVELDSQNEEVTHKKKLNIVQITPNIRNDIFGFKAIDVNNRYKGGPILIHNTTIIGLDLCFNGNEQNFVCHEGVSFTEKNYSELIKLLTIIFIEKKTQKGN